MSGDRVLLKVLKENSDGARRAGVPRERWKEAIRSNLRNIGVSDWRTYGLNSSD